MVLVRTRIDGLFTQLFPGRLYLYHRSTVGVLVEPARADVPFRSERDAHQLFFALPMNTGEIERRSVKQKDERLYSGFIALAIKTGPKLLSILGKGLKGMKVGKVGLAAGSMATYSVMFTWEFALAMMAMLFIHEGGHVWAMRRVGMRTKGIYLIPGLGGVAVAEDDFPSRGAEVFVAIAGPIAGLLLAALAGCAYLISHSPMWAAISGWMALVNVINLAPVNPLDGGRIVKSIAFSIGTRLGLVLLAAGLCVGIVAAQWLGLGLVVFITVVGGFELFFEYKRSQRESEGDTPPKPTMSNAEMGLALLSYLIVTALLIALMHSMGSEPGADVALEILKDKSPTIGPKQ